MRFWRRATLRGHVLVAAGLASTVVGVFTSQRDLVWPGTFLVLLVAGAVGLVSWPVRGLRHERRLAADPVPVGAQVRVSLTVHAPGRIRRLLHFEEVVPRHMGVRPRFSLSEVAGKTGREFHYTLEATRRGRHQVGPLLVRSIDPFGLATHDMAFSSTTTVSVTPQVHDLAPINSGTAGDRTSDRASALGLVGADDVLVREYRPGDEVRRVHWRSTARTGQLMVRREEQSWSPATMLLIDNRADAHAGTGSGSSFEWSVSAVASAGVALLRSSARVTLADATGLRPGPETSMTAPRLLNELTDITLATSTRLTDAFTQAGSTGILAVLGRLSQADLAVLSAVNTRAASARAILLEVDTFADGRRDPSTGRAARILTARGWQVTIADAATPVPLAWELLNDPQGVR